MNKTGTGFDQSAEQNDLKKNEQERNSHPLEDIIRRNFFRQNFRILAHYSDEEKQSGENADYSPKKSCGYRFLSRFDMVDAEENSRNDSQIIQSIFEASHCPPGEYAGA
ncbi:hypothetical protein ES703_40869 [subsurface metagenome]